VGNYEPRRVESLMLSEPDAAARRLEALAQATFDLPSDAWPTFHDGVPGAMSDPQMRAVPTCRFIETEPSGTTPKFDCVFDGGDIVKVKYGRNSEIHAEVAATRLMRMMGYASDTVTIVPRVRCYGCPRYPFLSTHLQSMVGIPLLSREGTTGGYTDFEWVAIERKLPARAIETATDKGWGWWELKRSQAPSADVDAFRLTAMFLAHWDNKNENQRLVCLDAVLPPSDPLGPAAAGDGGCARPLAMIQDLGATFGPLKVNLARWRDLPVWQDREACVVSMRALPYRGATFPDARISEAGRLQFAARMAAITEADITRLFAEARFPEFQVGTDEDRDLRAWTAAFRHRVDQIVEAGPCPSA
jgi:hypothetical protein